MKIENKWSFITGVVIDTLIETIATILRSVPGLLGIFLRHKFYKRRLKSLGKGVIIDVGVHFLNPKCISIQDNTWIDKNVILAAGKPMKDERIFIEKENKSYKGAQSELEIGKGCHIAPNVVVQAHGGVEIGDYVTLASGSKVYSMSHHYKNLNDPSDRTIYKFSSMAPLKEQCLIISPVVMEDNTALGLNSVILPGVTIGENSWVGVNSSVINDIPPDSIAQGSPAKVFKGRFK